MIAPFISVIALAGIIFICIIINVISEKEFSKKITTCLFIYAAVAGIFFYGYALSISEDNVFVASLRAMQTMYLTFGGKDSYSLVSSIPLFSNKLVLFLYWFMHIAASYVVTNAILKSFGKKLLRKLRWIQNSFADLNIIYGVNKDTLRFGKEIMDQNERFKRKQSTIYVDDTIDDKFVSKIYDLDATLSYFKEMKNNSKKLSKKLHLKTRKRINIYCLKDEQNDNYEFAKNFKNVLKNGEISCEKTYLTLIGDELYINDNLKCVNKYGYGQVFVINKRDLAARVMLKNLPAWSKIGRENPNFNALVIGFGQTGKSVLKYLIMNGCFADSQSIIKVVGKDKKQDAINFDLNSSCYLFGDENDKNKYLSLNLEHIEGVDARSKIIKDYIIENIGKLNYIVICTGKEDLDEEIFGMIYEILYIAGGENLCQIRNKVLAICSKNGITYCANNGSIIRIPLISLDNLDVKKIDKLAIDINAVYNKIKKCIDGKANDKYDEGSLDKWSETNYFDKESSRAAADFSEYYKEKYKEGVSIEKLGETEHIRWTAFHYVMGYQKMDIEEVKKRCEKYNAGEKLKVSKDISGRRHACMIPWSELDNLSRIENEICHLNADNQKDYKKYDINNVELLIK